MVTFAAVESDLSLLKKRFEEILSGDVKQWTREVEFGKFGFSDCAQLLEALKTMTAELYSLNWQSLPRGQITKLIQCYSELNGVIDKMTKFSMSVQDPERMRNGLADQLEQVHQSWFEIVVPILTLLRTQEIRAHEVSLIAALKQDLEEKKR